MYKERKKQKKIYEKRRKYMEDKDKNGDGGSRSYQCKKWGDRKNQKDQKS